MKMYIPSLKNGPREAMRLVEEMRCAPSDAAASMFDEARFDVFALIAGVYPVECEYVEHNAASHDDVQERLTLIARIVYLARIVRQGGDKLIREQEYALRIAEDVVEALREMAYLACPSRWECEAPCPLQHTLLWDAEFIRSGQMSKVMDDVHILCEYENECESHNAAWPWEDLAYMQNIYAQYHQAVERALAATQPDEIQAEVEAAFAALLQVLQDAQGVIDTIVD